MVLFGDTPHLVRRPLVFPEIFTNTEWQKIKFKVSLGQNQVSTGGGQILPWHKYSNKGHRCNKGMVPVAPDFLAGKTKDIHMN